MNSARVVCRVAPGRVALLIALLSTFLFSVAASAQLQDLSHKDPKKRMRAADKVARLKDPVHIPPLEKLLTDPLADVRAKAVAAIVSIGTHHSLPPLIVATRDSIPAIQIMAVDGLVNFYHPSPAPASLGLSTFRRLYSHE